jgi:HPt (histidine-containing phosphotransfer) domain-containing protein
MEDEARLSTLTLLANERRGDDLARLAHTVAGSCASLGANEAGEFIHGLGRLAREGNWTDVAAKMKELPKVWARLHAALAEVMKGGRL